MTVKSIFFVFLSVVLTTSLGAQNLGGKTFVIKNFANGKVLDGDTGTIGKNGGIVHTWDIGANGAMPNQQWKLVDSGLGDNKFFIVNQHPKAGNSPYLEVASAEVGKNGGTIRLWDYNGGPSGPYGPNQVWQFNKNSDGTYAITSVSSGGYALELSGNDTKKNGGKIQTWWNRGYKNQKWTLVEVR